LPAISVPASFVVGDPKGFKSADIVIEPLLTIEKSDFVSNNFPLRHHEPSSLNRCKIRHFVCRRILDSHSGTLALFEERHSYPRHSGTLLDNKRLIYISA
jgi:hypothetical protein